MKTIEILLTSPNPLLRRLAKGLLKLGYQNLEIKTKKVFYLHEDHIIEVGGLRVLIQYGTQGSTFWFCRKYTDRGGNQVTDFVGDPIVWEEEVTCFLKKLRRCKQLKLF